MSDFYRANGLAGMGCGNADCHVELQRAYPEGQTRPTLAECRQILVKPRCPNHWLTPYVVDTGKR